jgi:SAM-dependent methyltransferase
MYGPEYFGKRFDYRRPKMQAQERARLLKHVSSGRILDVGCGDGAFLYGLDDRWEKWGVDVSPFVVPIAGAKGIRMVPFSPTWPEEFTDDSFDVVVFRGTIQHIDDPFYILRECVRILRPEGLMVFLATPNTGAICYRLFGELPALDPERNWLVVSDGQLINILTRLGMRIEDVVYPYLETPYAQPVRDHIAFALRLLGRRRAFPFWGNMMEVYARKPVDRPIPIGVKRADLPVPVWIGA